MPRISLWKQSEKTNDYNFQDKLVYEQFIMGGTGVFIHKYLGTVEVDEQGNAKPISTTNIEDVLLMENRNRKYDPQVYEMRGHYTLNDLSTTLALFGTLLDPDMITISFHLTSMVERIGRKLMAGDVIELPHRREQFALNGIPATNKLYVISDANYPAEGYSSTWWPHLWRVKCTPILDTQEYQDILNSRATDRYGIPGDAPITLGDILSVYDNEIGISNELVAEAESKVPYRNFQTAHLYVVPGQERGSQYPWIFAGDKIPPNESSPANPATSFPETPADGEYCLRTDYEPNILFRYKDGIWGRIEIDWRKKWCAASRILESFINNRSTTTINSLGPAPSRTIPSKQSLAGVITPREDKLIGLRKDGT